MSNETYDQEYLKSENCPVTNCILTNNKNFLKDVNDYDALVFHIASDKHFSKSIVPKYRNPNQFYIMATKE
jgi:alpha-1,3-fucosyltransferase